MKAPILRLTAASLVAVCIASSVSCYPAYPANYNSAYNQDSKGYNVQGDPAPQPAPRYVVDPAVAIAGVAAAGLLGYAIADGHHHGHHHGHYYGPRYYYRGGPRYYRR